MNVWLLVLIFCVGVIPLHEFGHYLLYRFFGYNPSIDFNLFPFRSSFGWRRFLFLPFPVIFIGGNVNDVLRVKEKVIIAFGGLVFGGLFLFVDYSLFVANFFASFLDLLIIVALLYYVVLGVDWGRRVTEVVR